MKADTVGMKKRKATKMAKSHLKNASSLLHSNEKGAFYEAVSNALYGYLSNKFNLSNTELNKSNIQKVLIGVQVDANTLQELLATLDHCEMARFAPVSNISKEDLLKQAENIIVKLEDEIK